jgi:hypothetical protein
LKLYKEIGSHVWGYMWSPSRQTMHEDGVSRLSLFVESLQADRAWRPGLTIEIVCGVPPGRPCMKTGDTVFLWRVCELLWGYTFSHAISYLCGVNCLETSIESLARGNGSDLNHMPLHSMSVLIDSSVFLENLTVTQLSSKLFSSCGIWGLITVLTKASLEPFEIQSLGSCF